MKPKQLIAAGALVGLLAVGGASIASAQDSGGSGSTQTPSTSPSAPPSQSQAPYGHGNGNCPNMGQPSNTTPSANATSV